MSTPTKLTPLHATIQKLNAQFVEQAGWQVAALFDNQSQELAAARERVALIDSSANGKIMLEGDQVADVLYAFWGVSLEVGQGQTADGDQLYCLRPDRYFVRTTPGAETAVIDRIRAALPDVSGLITITDATHGRAELGLVGPASAELLSRLCGLDFHSSQFPNQTAKQSSVAKTTQLVIRRDIGVLPAYSLIGAASLGAYLWETIIQAGQDLGITPIGQLALATL